MKAIDSLQKININDSEQWILTRGRNKNAPLILQVQAGPGLPHICYAEAMQRNLKWENDYVVTYWDQRACGKSYRRNIDPATISLEQYVDDILACTKYLLEKYNREKLILIGYSLGATAALIAAAKDSSLFHHVILVGIDVDILLANNMALDFALLQASIRDDEMAIRQAELLKKQPIVNNKLFEQRAKLVSQYGGIVFSKTYNQLFMDALKCLWQSKAYSMVDILKTVKGIRFGQNNLLPKIQNLNLFQCEIDPTAPIHFIHGAKDAIAPLELTQYYFKHIEKSDRALYIFNNSAHMPHEEEPTRFYGLLKRILSGTPAVL